MDSLNRLGLGRGRAFTARSQCECASMSLTPEQLAKRQFKITASMLPILMHGDEAALLKLYREEIGESERETNYAMELGSVFEPFILDYQQRKTGHAITRRGEVVDLESAGGLNFCCTLDGYREHDDAVVESKFLAPWRHREEFVAYYYPQVLGQIRCVEATRGILLVGQGTAEPVEYEIAPRIDDVIAADYEREMWARVRAFQHCMRTFTPPVEWKRVVTPEVWRTVDLRKGEIPNWGQPMLELLDL